MDSLPTPESVRGGIYLFLKRNFHLLKSPVIEVGSKVASFHKDWANNKIQCGKIGLKHVGVDLSEGHGVDVVGNILGPPVEREHKILQQEFRGAILSESLEHISDPCKALLWVKSVLASGSSILITTPFGFPVHGFPDDYWRFTPSGMSQLALKAGLRVSHVEEINPITITISDHGVRNVTRRLPLTIGCVMEKL